MRDDESGLTASAIIENTTESHKPITAAFTPRSHMPFITALCPLSPEASMKSSVLVGKRDQANEKRLHHCESNAQTGN